MKDREIEIDEEFRSLIPPPTPEELAQLEANLLKDGCIDPIVVWSREGILLDGHNRHEICTRHDIEFETVELDLPDRESAIVWIVHNQLGRRNLEPYVKIEMVLKIKPFVEAIEARARANQGTRTDLSASLHESETVDTLSELANLAGVSRRTMAKGKAIVEDAPDELKQQLRNGQTSMNAAYNEIRPRPVDHPRHVPLPGQASLPLDDEEDKEEEEAQAKVPDPAEAFADAWTKKWDDWNRFFVSLPRRGGIVNLVGGWPAVRVKNAIHILRELGSTCIRCADELQEKYP